MTLLLWLLLLILSVQEDAARALARGEEERALSIYRRQLEEDPGNRAVAWQVGHILYSQDDLEGARAIFEDSERRHGRQAYSAYMLGAIAEAEFRYGAAKALYQQGVEADTRYAPAREGIERIGQILEDLVRFRSARQRLNRELAVVLAAAALLAGLAYLLIGRTALPRET